MARVKKLSKKYSKWYNELECMLYHRDVEIVRLYIASVINFAESKNKAFDSVFGSKNYISALDYQREMAETCLRVYAYLQVDYKNRLQFLKKFVDGKSPQKTRAQGEFLTDGELKKRIILEFPQVAQAYDEGNQSIHFGNFYLDSVGGKLGSTLSATYAFAFSSDWQEKLLGTMCDLNEVLLAILWRITMETYACFPFCYDDKTLIPMLKVPVVIDCMNAQESTWALWMNLSDVAAYICETEMQFGRLYKEHEGKASMLGRDRQTMMNILSPITMEINRCWWYLGVIKTIMEREGEDALKNYKARWLMVKIVHNEEIGNVMEDIEPVSEKDLRVELDLSFYERVGAVECDIVNNPEKYPQEFLNALVQKVNVLVK